MFSKVPVYMFKSNFRPIFRTNPEAMEKMICETCAYCPSILSFYQVQTVKGINLNISLLFCFLCSSLYL